MTAARPLALWPLWGALLITFVLAPGVIGGSLAAAMLHLNGADRHGKLVVAFGALGALVGFFAMEPVARVIPMFGPAVYALCAYAGMAAGAVMERPVVPSKLVGLGVVVFVVGVAIPASLTSVDATFSGWRSILVALAATTLVSGVGLGLLLSPRQPLVDEASLGTGHGSGAILMLAAASLFAFRVMAIPPAPAFEGARPLGLGSSVLLGLAVVFGLVAAQRLVAAYRVARAPTLRLSASPEESARVVRHDGTVFKVHVEGERQPGEQELTLLAYHQETPADAPYRANLAKVTADVVFHGPPRLARDILRESAGAWLGWAMFTAAVASYGL